VRNDTRVFGSSTVGAATARLGLAALPVWGVLAALWRANRPRRSPRLLPLQAGAALISVYLNPPPGYQLVGRNGVVRFGLIPPHEGNRARNRTISWQTEWVSTVNLTLAARSDFCARRAIAPEDLTKLSATCGDAAADSGLAAALQRCCTTRVSNRLTRPRRVRTLSGETAFDNDYGGVLPRSKRPCPKSWRRKGRVRRPVTPRSSRARLWRPKTARSARPFFATASTLLPDPLISRSYSRSLCPVLRRLPGEKNRTCARGAVGHFFQSGGDRSARLFLSVIANLGFAARDHQPESSVQKIVIALV